MTEVPPFADPNYLQGCKVTFNRQQVFTTLKGWAEFANKHSLVWFIMAGTLLGSLRSVDLVARVISIVLG